MPKLQTLGLKPKKTRRISSRLKPFTRFRKIKRIPSSLKFFIRSRKIKIKKETKEDEKTLEKIDFQFKSFGFKKSEKWIEHLKGNGVYITPWALDLLSNMKDDDFYEANISLNVCLEKIKDANKDDYLKLKSNFREKLQNEKAELILFVSDFLCTVPEDFFSLFFKKEKKRNIFILHNPIKDSDGGISIFVLSYKNYQLELRADYYKHDHKPEEGRVIGYLDRKLI